LLCEDELDELHRRQDDINRHYGIDYGYLKDCLHWIPRVGENNLLQDSGSRYAVPEETPLYHAIAVHVRSCKAKLLILDSLYNIYGGSEIDRASVECFVVSLRRLAMLNDCAVIFTSHPSIEGMNSGRGYSGSTGWNAIVRSRLYLTASDDPTDEDARTLKTMKLNYGKKVEYRLEWSEGVFVRKDRDTGPVAQMERRSKDKAILELVAEYARKGRHLSKEPRSVERYLPAIAARRGIKRDLAKKIMENLLMDGAIDYRLVDSNAKRKGLVVVTDTPTETHGDANSSP
jgi:RecA-family ATPase